LVGGPPGIELHTVVDELPSGDTGTMLPVPLPTIGAEIVPKAVVGIVVVDDSVVVDCVAVGVMTAMDVEIVPGMVDGVGTGVAVMEGRGGAGVAGSGGAGTVEPGMVDMNDVAGCAESASGVVVLVVVEVEPAATVGAVENDGVVPGVPPIADMDVTGTAGVAGAICPVGVEQVTTVPGVVGSEASGTGANVLSGAPGWVAAENGLGLLSGEVTIVPGVDESPMAVVPMVETCARLALQPASKETAVNSRRRIAIASSPRSSSSAVCAPRPCCLRRGSPSD
jgi:hypothetical protein